MTRGRIVLVPFPFDDLATEKARPAVCLTEPMTAHRHIVLAFVTSRPSEDPLDTDIALDPQDPDFAGTGLQVRSTIRIHRLLTQVSVAFRSAIRPDQQRHRGPSAPPRSGLAAYTRA